MIEEESTSSFFRLPKKPPATVDSSSRDGGDKGPLKVSKAWCDLVFNALLLSSSQLVLITDTEKGDEFDVEEAVDSPALVRVPPN